MTPLPASCRAEEKAGGRGLGQQQIDHRRSGDEREATATARPWHAGRRGPIPVKTHAKPQRRRWKLCSWRRGVIQPASAARGAGSRREGKKIKTENALTGKQTARLIDGHRGRVDEGLRGVDFQSREKGAARPACRKVKGTPARHGTALCHSPDVEEDELEPRRLG